MFDIGSSSVGAGLVKFKKNRIPEIIYTARESIPFQEVINPQRFFSDMIKTLSIVNSNILKEGILHLKFTRYGGLKIKHVFYAFSSPWSVSQTKIMTLEKSKPEVVTKEMINRIVDKEEKDFESGVVEPSRIPDFKEKLAVVERRIMQIRLNGYETPDPYGKSARTIDISFFLSLVPKMVLDETMDISVNTYHPKDTKVASSSLVAFSTIRDVLHNKEDFILLDIGGEISDVSVVKNNLILETASFPMGRNFLTRRVSRTLSVSQEEAVSLLRLLFENHADQSVVNRLQPAIETASKEWVEALHTVLTKISGNLSLPQDLFVIINNEFTSFFMKAIHKERITQWDVIDVPFRVTLVNHDHLKKFVAFSKTAIKDPKIALESIFAAKMMSL